MTRSLFGPRALALSLLAAYLLLALGFRAAQAFAWAPEGTLVEAVLDRLSPEAETVEA